MLQGIDRRGAAVEGHEIRFFEEGPVGIAAPRRQFFHDRLDGFGPARPMAVALIAMSTTSGRPSAEGNAIDKGLLPTTRCAPPGAGIKGRVFEKAKPTMPSAATWRVQNAAVPK